MSKGRKFQESNVGLWPALLRASCLLFGITILGVGAKGIGTVKVEKAQVFFRKLGVVVAHPALLEHLTELQGEGAGGNAQEGAGGGTKTGYSVIFYPTAAQQGDEIRALHGGPNSV
jgi:hypothetical protein